MLKFRHVKNLCYRLTLQASNFCPEVLDLLPLCSDRHLVCFAVPLGLRDVRFEMRLFFRPFTPGVLAFVYRCRQILALPVRIE